MKNDLISREALKKEIASYDREFAPDWVLNRIDNAPTVPSWEQGYEAGLAQGKQDRPKGEWIKNKGRDLRDNFYTCSICGRTINVICGETLADYPYCHCGTDMRKGDTK